MGTRRSPDMYTQERTYKKRSIKETCESAYTWDINMRKETCKYIQSGKKSYTLTKRPKYVYVYKILCLSDLTKSLTKKVLCMFYLWMCRALLRICRALFSFHTSEQVPCGFHLWMLRALLRIHRALLQTHWVLLRIHWFLCTHPNKCPVDFICGCKGLFCGYIGLFCRLIGLFCGYIGFFAHIQTSALWISFVYVKGSFVDTLGSFADTLGSFADTLGSFANTLGSFHLFSCVPRQTGRFSFAKL